MSKPTPTISLQQLSDALTDIVVRSAPSIVAVHCGHSRFSGFVWRPGLIVTADEPLDDEGDIAVALPGGETAAANLVGRDPTTDVALFRVDRTDSPPADAPPVNGVLKFFTDLDESLMERLQRDFPDANLVKAFNSVGNTRMVNPQFTAGKPTMFICGNNERAKIIVAGILDQFGWDTADMGKVEAARAIEPLCMLWCIPGFLRNEWMHAFALLK